MRIFLAMAMAASLLVAAGCSCATGTCDTGCDVPVAVADDCNTCEVAAPVAYVAPAPAVAYVAPAPAPVVIAAAPAPTAVAPVITCNPCAGL